MLSDSETLSRRDGFGGSAHHELSMSRHDAVLENASYSHDSLARQLADALREEMAAHDKTREERNKATQRASGLAGNVRSLEVKVHELQARLRDVTFAPVDEYVRGQRDALNNAEQAIKELFETLR